MILQLSRAAERRMQDALIDMLEGGGVELYEGDMGGGGGRLLASLEFGAPAFERRPDGSAVARNIEQVKAVATGRAQWARVIDGAGETVIECDVGPADAANTVIQLNTTALVAGGWVGLRAVSLMLRT